MNPTLKAKLEILVTAFGGGVTTYLTTHLGEGVPTTLAQWEAFAIGAIGAGAAAAYHRYQSAPQDLAALKAAAAKVAAAAILLLALGGTARALSGCATIEGWFGSHPQTAPDLAKLVQCAETELTKDASSGESDVQIGIDLAGACGLDVGQVIADALANTADAGALSKAAVLRAARAAGRK
jgi:hypothetical protein